MRERESTPVNDILLAYINSRGGVGGSKQLKECKINIFEKSFIFLLVFMTAL